VELVNRGEKITVTVSAPSNANTVLPVWFFGNGAVKAQAKMVRE
jgi:hypothetical protein